MATLKIRAANALNPLQQASMSSLAPHLPRTHVSMEGSSKYSISLAAATDLSESLRDRIYNLFDDNMSPLSATTSMSYTESSKREELFDRTGRVILLRRRISGDQSGRSPSGEGDSGVDMPGALPSSTTRGKQRASVVDFPPDQLVGYVSFRFDTEETLGPKDAEVIYCYELQLDQSVRRSGLGQMLMDEMESIGRRRGLDKAMLTCLKSNNAALAFYRKQGYEPDEIDPTRMAVEPDSDSEDEEWERVGGEDEEEEEADYVILSKPLR